MRSRLIGALTLGMVATLCALTLAAPRGVAAHGAEAPAPRLPDVALAWSFDPLLLSALGLAAAAWLWATRRVDARHPASRVPIRRHAAFAACIGLLVLALASPIERYEGSLFSVHMLQHMILQFAAAPALLYAAPITLALRAASPSVRRGLLRLLNSRLVHLITHPLIAWLLFAAVNWFWHFSPLYDQALESLPLHYLQHATLFGAALLFWTPIVAVDPTRWRLSHPVRLLYLFLAMPQNSFLGLAIYSAGDVLFPHYASNQRSWGPPPLEDQQLAGALMWVGGDVVFLAAMVVVVAGWMRYEEHRTARLDARLDAQLALAAAGGGAVAPSGQRQVDEAVDRDRGEQQRQVADREPKES